NHFLASFPTRRSSDLHERLEEVGADRGLVAASVPPGEDGAGSPARRGLADLVERTVDTHQLGAHHPVLVLEPGQVARRDLPAPRSEEHTSELQSRENL